MTQKFDKVYVNNIATTAGLFESKGPLAKYFDLTYKDFYNNESSFEDAEVSMMRDSINILLKKENKKLDDINLFIGGDLLNQLYSSNFIYGRRNE